MKIYDNNELRKRVDEVLYYIWDPIGVSTCPSARGEYSDYVSDILKLLENNNSLTEISEQLEYFRIETMGLPGNKEKSDFTAQILQDHKKAVQQGFA